jgi:hypothetical protein
VYHCYFETLLDSLIGNAYHTRTHRPDKLLALSASQLAAISALWVVGADALNVKGISSDSFAQAVQDYRSILRFTNFPPHLKHLFFNVFLPKSLPWAMTIPAKLPRKRRGLDFLNKQHASWPDPTSGLSRNEAFFDLWADAADDYHAFLPLLAAAKAGAPDTEEAFRVFVKGINHDGSPIGAVKNYRDILWPELR